MAARDHFGVKPLYWWSDGRRVALASEVGALLAAGLAGPRWTAWRSTTSSRAASCPRRGPCSRVSEAPAGVRAHGGRGRRRPAHDQLPRGAGRPDRRPRTRLAHELAERFTDAVERQMMSDVPYGAFLSGGVDSAAVVAAMALRAPTRPPRSRSASRATATCSTSAAPPPRRARLIGTDHHDTAMEEADFLAELARCVPRLEEPCGIPSAPALLQLSRFAAGDVKVVLAGQGADEPHGGYGRHQAAALLGGSQHVPPALAAPAAALARALPRAASARRAAHLLGGRGDAERLLRLVEISDAPRCARRSLGRGGAEAEAERLARAPRRAGRRRRPRPARAGALPRHAHVPARRDPDLQRQDVDGRRPRAARAVPRPSS